jgi:hypothetical protein
MMLKKTTKLFLQISLFVFALNHVSCGIKTTSVSEDAAAPKSEERPLVKDEPQSFQVTDVSKLPECRETREGAIAFIKSSKQFKVCEGGNWNELDLGHGTQAPSAAPCAISKSGLMSSITCGPSSVSIQDGLSADGAACAVSKTGSLATISCGASSVSISDGAQGSQGTTGNSCSVSKASGVATVVCGSQTVQVVDGIAGVGCSVSKTGSVATVSCGSQSVTLTDGITGTQGPQGAQGVSGFNALVDFVNEPPGSNCMGGGTKLISGLDNGDGAGVARNGVLESDEVDTFRYLCKDPSSYAVAGQKLFSGSNLIGTIVKRFLTWEKDYNQTVLVPSDELFLISNAAGNAKVLHRAARINTTVCSGKAGDSYAFYETCADSETQLTAHSETVGFYRVYGTANCTGTAYLGKSGSYYQNNNPFSFDQTGFLNFVASQGTDVHFGSGTQWTRLTSSTTTSIVAKSVGTFASCNVICRNSDTCYPGSSDNAVTIEAFPFATASESDVGIPLTIPAGWKTY